ncbi:MAG: hypothetical protein IKL57_04165 [Oscillospiraceae bacterium]|nr:hypothetical protein [Oscillospiraceae bacterium]
MYCSKCGNELSGGKFCSGCGAEDDFENRVSSTIATMKCMQCGEKIVVTDKYCHSCGAINRFANPEKPKARFCKNCGIEFENGECPLCGAKQSEALDYVDYSACPNCANFIDEYAHFCPICGAAHSKKTSANKTAEKPSSSGYAENPSTKSAEYQAILDSDVPAPNAFLWLILGIVQLVICCNPFAIGTIICANKAQKRINAGKNRAARKSVRAAITWFVSGFASVALIYTVYFIMAAF